MILDNDNFENWKTFVLFVTPKTQTERFVGKWQIDSFAVENKDLTKTEIG